MNRRRFLQLLLISLLSLIGQLEFDCRLFAQSNQPAGQRLNRKRLERPELQVPRLTPELETILKDWSEA